MTTLNIEKLVDRPAALKVLIYGDPGVGKTVFASTAPRPILWLESEGGTQSIGDKKDIDIARVTGLGDYREALTYLVNNPDKYQTVVIDSLSETQAHVLKDIMRTVVSLDPKRDEFAPQFGEWGKLTGVMREIVRAYRDLPMNVIFTALTREDKDDLTGRTRIRPKLSPSLADDVPAFVDACIYLYTATSKSGEVAKDGAQPDEEGLTIVRNGLLKPTGKYVAKLRAPKGSNPPDFLPDPTFDAISKLVYPSKSK